MDTYAATMPNVAMRRPKSWRREYEEHHFRRHYKERQDTSHNCSSLSFRTFNEALPASKIPFQMKKHNRNFTNHKSNHGSRNTDHSVERSSTASSDQPVIKMESPPVEQVKFQILKRPTVNGAAPESTDVLSTQPCKSNGVKNGMVISISANGVKKDITTETTNGLENRLTIGRPIRMANGTLHQLPTIPEVPQDARSEASYRDILLEKSVGRTVEPKIIPLQSRSGDFENDRSYNGEYLPELNENENTHLKNGQRIPDDNDTLLLDLGCKSVEYIVLDPRLLEKIHSLMNDTNCNLSSSCKISTKCGISQDCDCIRKYLLSNCLIGYVVNQKGEVQMIISPYKKINPHENSSNTSTEEEEDIIINFAQLQQKYMIKSRLRQMNYTASSQRPDDTHFSKLDSSLKRNTAFVRKLKIFTGSQLERLLEDLVSLNLTKYITEIAAALVECKLKMCDVWAAVQLCSVLHQMYSEFATHLLENWQKCLAIKKDEPLRNAAKLRVDLKFYADLLSVGIFTRREGLPLLSNALSALAFLDKGNQYNMKILLSFYRNCGTEFAGLIPRKVRQLSEKYNIPTPQSFFLAEAKMQVFRTVIKDYYDSLQKHLIKEYRTLHDFSMQNKRILQTKGELRQERKEKLETLQISLKRLLEGSAQLAEVLDEEIPRLPHGDTLDNDLFSVCENDDLSIIEIDSLWDDEESKSFYECLPDLKEYGIQPQNVSLTEEDPEKGELSLLEELSCEDSATDDTVNDDSTGELEDDDEADTTTNVNNKVLMELFINSLPNCMTQELTDKAATEFVKTLNNKPNRRKLVKTLFNVPRTRPDLLPFYARLVASVHPVIPDIAADLAQMLKQEFRYLVRKKDQLNIESKIKVTRFIGELVKFRMYSKTEALHCLKMLVQDFSHHHIDMSCSLLESCGRFLSRHSDSNFRLNYYVEQIMRKKCAIPLDARYVTMIENAYYQINPPPVPLRTCKKRPDMHEFIRKLLYQDLTRSNIDEILNLILKLDWDDPSIASYSVKCLTNAHKVKYYNISSLASLTAGVALQQDSEGIQVVDGVLEGIQLEMELNLIEHCQRRVAMIKYLGELYNYRMLENSSIFQVLYSLIKFGVTWDHAVYSEADPPQSTFRIKLICTLLHTCGEYFSSGSSKKKLDIYLVFFQYYYWFKFSHPFWNSENQFPYDVKFLFQDTMKYLRPTISLYETLEEAKQAVYKLYEEFEGNAWHYGKSSIHNDDQYVLLASNYKTTHYQEKTDEALTSTSESLSASDESSAEDKEVEITTHETTRSNHMPSSNIESMTEIATRDDNCKTSTCYCGKHPTNVACDEDEEFVSAFDRMVSENMQERLKESVKPPQLDISVPLHTTIKRPSEHKPLSGNKMTEMNFVVMLRKGHKAQYKNVCVPANSEMALNLKNHEEAERAEREQVKRLTLNITERLEEEDYQESLYQTQKLIVGNLNREKKSKYQHPRGVPDVDLIFHQHRKGK